MVFTRHNKASTNGAQEATCLQLDDGFFFPLHEEVVEPRQILVQRLNEVLLLGRQPPARAAAIHACTSRALRCHRLRYRVPHRVLTRSCCDASSCG